MFANWAMKKLSDRRLRTNPNPEALIILQISIILEVRYKIKVEGINCFISPPFRKGGVALTEHSEWQ